MTAFDNSQTREATLWEPFLHYGFYNDVQEAERAVIFGLYSNSYRNNDAYIQGVYGIALANIIAEFDSKMAQLSVEEQKLVMDIVTKRYVLSLDGLVHDSKMVTELKKINAQSDEWDAKMAALATDRAALETLRVKIAAEIKKINARIMELQAYIQLEVAQLAMVDIDIAEKNLALGNKNVQLAEKDIEESRKDIAILNAANDIAKIQLQIVEAGLQLVEVDMKVARTRVDIAQTENQIAKAGMAESELEVAIARTAAEEAELATYDSKLDLARMQVESIAKEVTNAESAIQDDGLLYDENLTSLNAKQVVHLQALANQTEKSIFGVLEREIALGLEKAVLGLTGNAQIAIDAKKLEQMTADSNAAFTRMNAAIQRAMITADATITSNLTHLIKKA